MLTCHDYRWICPANTFFFKRTQEVCPKANGNLSCFSTTLQKHCLTPRPQFSLPFYKRIQKVKRVHPALKQVIAPSYVAKERLLAAGWHKDTIKVLPYFCPLTPLDAPRPIPKTPTITFIGRIAPNKGQEYFIQALGALPKEWQGIMVGDINADNEKTLLEKAKLSGCEDRIKLHPWASREGIKNILDQTTVFIFPSLWQETLGIVAIEALSRGIPVIATNITGISDWLKDQQFGRLVPTKDANAIKEAVLDLNSSEQRLTEAGQAGIQLIKSQFSPEHHINELISTYKSAIK